MIKEISLIIPSQNAETKLINLIGCIPNWDVIPNEIIVVDSSEVKPCIPEKFKQFLRLRSFSGCLYKKKCTGSKKNTFR